jgi:arginine-tRNA-protein transferase
VPVRVPVAHFTPNRTQRKVRNGLSALLASAMALNYDEEHYALYRRYQSVRHPGGGMDQDSRDQYEQFLLQSRINSRLVEFRDPTSANPRGALRMVSIIDILSDGISSVYTFFDPDQLGSSYGTYNILWQIEQTNRLGLPYLYLGYWISESRKMAYKTNFRPLEGLIDGRWQPLSSTAQASDITRKPAAHRDSAAPLWPPSWPPIANHDDQFDDPSANPVPPNYIS